MILADTSVWVDHFRKTDPVLMKQLGQENILIHPFVVGELACGNIKNRLEVLDLLQRLPIAPSVSDKEALEMIERHSLMSTGVGIIDVHLLASAAISPDSMLWTHDKRLSTIAGQLGISFTPN